MVRAALPTTESPKMSDPHRAPEAQATKGHNEFGTLPEWDLSDLYPGVDSPELKRDLEWAESEAKAFEADYKGKLDQLTKDGKLIEAIRRTEKLGDVTGRIGSFAYLHYAQDTSDEDRTKFLGDMSQKLTDLSTGLIFFELELNRIDDAVLEAGVCRRQGPRPLPPLVHRAAEGQALPARRSRRGTVP